MTLTAWVLVLAMPLGLQGAAASRCLPEDFKATTLVGAVELPVLRLVQRNWASHNIMRELVSLLVNEVLGWPKPSSVQISTRDEVAPALGSQVDLDVEYWPKDYNWVDSMLQDYQGVIVSPLPWGQTGYVGFDGLYAALPGAPSAEAGYFAHYLKHSDDSVSSTFPSASKLGLTPAQKLDEQWQKWEPWKPDHCDDATHCGAIIHIEDIAPDLVESLVAFYEMPFSVHYKNQSVAEQFVEQQLREGNPVIFYHWEPDLFLKSISKVADDVNRAAPVRVHFTPSMPGCDISAEKRMSNHRQIITKCDFPGLPLRRLATWKLKALNPSFYLLLDRLKVSPDEMDAMLDLSLDMTPTQATCKWANDNQEMLKAKLDPESLICGEGYQVDMESLSCQSVDENELENDAKQNLAGITLVLYIVEDIGFADNASKGFLHDLYTELKKVADFEVVIEEMGPGRYKEGFDRVWQEAATAEKCKGKEKCLPMTWSAHWLSPARLSKTSMIYSAPYLDGGVSILTPTPQIDIWIMVKPYSVWNWVAIAIALGTLVTAWYVFEHPCCSGKRDAKTDTIWCHYLYLGLTGCCQVDFPAPRSGPARIVLLGIALLGTIFVASYTAGLTNRLAQVKQVEYQELNDIVQKRGTLCVVEGDLEQFFFEASSAIPQLNSHALTCDSYEVALVKLRNGTCNAVLYDEVVNEHTAMKSRCKEQSPKKSVAFSRPYVFFAPKANPNSVAVLSALNLFLTKFRANGIMERLYENNFLGKNENEKCSKEEEDTEVTVWDMIGVYVFMLVLIGVAAIVWYLKHRFKKERKCVMEEVSNVVVSVAEVLPIHAEAVEELKKGHHDYDEDNEAITKGQFKELMREQRRTSEKMRADIAAEMKTMFGHMTVVPPEQHAMVTDATTASAPPEAGFPMLLEGGWCGEPPRKDLPPQGTACSTAPARDGIV